MGLAACDLFTNEEIFQKVFLYVPTVGLEEYNESFGSLGFDTTNLFYNLGDIALVQFYVFYLAIKLIVKKKDYDILVDIFP